MKRLLVTGSSGMLGSNIVFHAKDGYEVYGVYNSVPNHELTNQFRIDIKDHDKIKDALDSIRPDFIIHCAALTNVELCEHDYNLARATNALAAGNLVNAAGHRVRFIYISTESVFDGHRGRYSESDEPSPLNNYGRTKLEGERYIEQASDNHVIIRANMFGWNRVHGESFAEWVYNNLAQKNPVNMFTDIIFSPVIVNTLSSYVLKLMESDFRGRLHIGSSDGISKYEFGMRLAEKFGFDASLIKPVSVDGFNFKAKRPKNTTFDISKAESMLGKMAAIDEGLSGFYRIKDKGLG